MQHPALSKSSEQKLSLSKQICPTSRAGMVSEQPQGSQDAFDDAEPRSSPVRSQGQLRAVSLQAAAMWDARAPGSFAFIQAAPG